MSRKHALKVKSVKEETPNAVSIGFEVPTHLREEFDYEPGQYLTLELNIDGETIRRAYSLSSNPILDSELRVTIKRVENGLVSNYLNDHCKIGDSIEVLSAEGKFIPDLEESSTKNYLMIAAGSGITPVISIVSSILEIEAKSTISLLYGNRTDSEIIFKEQLETIVENYKDRISVKHFLTNPTNSWPGKQGRIGDQDIQTAISSLDENALEVYVCGPEGLINDAKSSLESKGVDESKIRIEYFTKTIAKSASAGIGEKAKLIVVLENEEHQVELASDQTILDASIDAGLDAPYSCKIAACCTCMAKLIEGKVVMEDDEILTDQEKEDGYILTCQSRAATPSIKVSYDEG